MENYYIWSDIRLLLFFSLHYIIKLLTVLLIRLKFCFENCSKSNVFEVIKHQIILLNVQIGSEGDKKDRISQ